MLVAAPSRATKGLPLVRRLTAAGAASRRNNWFLNVVRYTSKNYSRIQKNTRIV